MPNLHFDIAWWMTVPAWFAVVGLIIAWMHAATKLKTPRPPLKAVPDEPSLLEKAIMDHTGAKNIKAITADEYLGLTDRPRPKLHDDVIYNEGADEEGFLWHETEGFKRRAEAGDDRLLHDLGLGFEPKVSEEDFEGLTREGQRSKRDPLSLRYIEEAKEAQRARMERDWPNPDQGGAA